MKLVRVFQKPPPLLPHPALLMRRDGNAFIAVLLELVAQRPDGDAEDIGRMGAVAEAVL